MKWLGQMNGLFVGVAGLRFEGVIGEGIRAVVSTEAFWVFDFTKILLMLKIYKSWPVTDSISGKSVPWILLVTTAANGQVSDWVVVCPLAGWLMVAWT